MMDAAASTVALLQQSVRIRRPEASQKGIQRQSLRGLHKRCGGSQEEESFKRAGDCWKAEMVEQDSKGPQTGMLQGRRTERLVEKGEVTAGF